jgi:hypothetical protein
MIEDDLVSVATDKNPDTARGQVCTHLCDLSSVDAECQLLTIVFDSQIVGCTARLDGIAGSQT